MSCVAQEHAQHYHTDMAPCLWCSQDFKGCLDIILDSVPICVCEHIQPPSTTIKNRFFLPISLLDQCSQQLSSIDWKQLLHTAQLFKGTFLGTKPYRLAAQESLFKQLSAKAVCSL